MELVVFMNFHYRMAQNLTAKFATKDPLSISKIQQIITTSNYLFHLTITNFNYDARRTTRRRGGKRIGRKEVLAPRSEGEDEVSISP